MPWAYTCYGYRYLPKRHGCAPQAMLDPVEAAVVRDIYRALVEEQLSCRQITKRLNAAKTPTPTGKNAVWQHATVRNILANRTYTGQARYIGSRCSPRLVRRRSTDCGISRPADAIARERMGLERRAGHYQRRALRQSATATGSANAASARKMYRPTSRRYLLRTLVQCGECGLVCIRQRSGRKKYEYLYYV